MQHNKNNTMPIIYHVKKSKRSGLNMLNNIFQTPNAYSKSELDRMRSALSPTCIPNYWKFWAGNYYNIKVINSALKEKGCAAILFDKTKDVGNLDLYNICGFILNVPSGFAMLPYERRRWLAIKKFDGKFYNLDSKLRDPKLIGKEADLTSYLKEQLVKKNEVFVVVSREVEQKQLWMKGHD